MEMFKEVKKMDATRMASYNEKVLRLLKPKRQTVARLSGKELSKAIKQFKAQALNCLIAFDNSLSDKRATVCRLGFKSLRTSAL